METPESSGKEQFKLFGSESRPSGLASITANRGQGNEVITVRDMKESSKAFVITCKADNINTVALVDTGASTNFISHKFLQELMNDGRIRQIIMTLKLANQQTINTIGRVDIDINLGTRNISVNLLIVKQLAYPVILGCEFLRREKIL